MHPLRNTLQLLRCVYTTYVLRLHVSYTGLHFVARYPSLQLPTKSCCAVVLPIGSPVRSATQPLPIVLSTMVSSRQRPDSRAHP
jgi:hypothetical protein